MQLSTRGLDLIKQSEGFRASPYKDVAGILTIGYGHRIAPHESFLKPITEAEAETLLTRDIAIAEQSVARLIYVPLTQGQFDALVDFVFNLGSERLANSTLLRDLNAGRISEAAEQFLLWDHTDGKVNSGLARRRHAEFQLFTGTEVASNVSTRIEVSS
ncbi:MAG TPA: lysozyme [Terracidiphilus sp.]